MKILIVLCSFLLSGCFATVEPSVNIPAALTTKCQPLEKLAGITGADLLKNIVANSKTYYDCADKHDKLIEAVIKPNK